MKFSVVIPALNEQANIAAAISSAQDAGAHEIIVVDGGSRDETCPIARQMNCHLLHCAVGRGFQLHAGAMAAAGDVLVFLHADNALAPHCLKQIERLFRSTNKQFGVFHQRINADDWQFRLVEKGNIARVRLFGLTYGDQGIFVRKEFYFRVGGFPQIPLMEDVEFARASAKESRPAILAGPIHVSGRRWQRHGLIRQTFRNWALLIAGLMGVSPDRIAQYYRRHDSTRAEK